MKEMTGAINTPSFIDVDNSGLAKEMKGLL